jgi:hypothetical protein
MQPNCFVVDTNNYKILHSKHNLETVLRNSKMANGGLMILKKKMINGYFYK